MTQLALPTISTPTIGTRWEVSRGDNDGEGRSRE
jgi:hypothetical protein